MHSLSRLLRCEFCLGCAFVVGGVLRGSGTHTGLALVTFGCGFWLALPATVGYRWARDIRPDDRALFRLVGVLVLAVPLLFTSVRLWRGSTTLAAGGVQSLAWFACVMLPFAAGRIVGAWIRQAEP